MYYVKLGDIHSFYVNLYLNPTTVFLDPTKSDAVWEIIRPEDPLFPKAGEIEVPLSPDHFTCLQDAFIFLKTKNPKIVMYSSTHFDDMEAKLMSDFILESTSLIAIQYRYNSTGGYAYRQSGNKLSDNGYQQITQAIDINPSIICCRVGNYHISKELISEREEIIKRNLQAFNNKDPIARTAAYRTIYRSIKEKYHLPVDFGASAPQCQTPTLKELMKFEVERLAQTSLIPLENLTLDLLSELEPPTVALAQEMERLSLLRTPQARHIEILHIWKTLHTQAKPQAQSAHEASMPHFYCPPRLQ